MTGKKAKWHGSKPGHHQNVPCGRTSVNLAETPGCGLFPFPCLLNSFPHLIFLSQNIHMFKITPPTHLRLPNGNDPPPPDPKIQTSQPYVVRYSSLSTNPLESLTWRTKTLPSLGALKNRNAASVSMLNLAHEAVFALSSAFVSSRQGGQKDVPFTATPEQV